MFILIKELFINMAILISFISLGSQLTKKFKFTSSDSIHIQMVIGIVLGTLGITLMLFSIKINTNTLIDFRNIATIIAGILGGAIPAFISGIIIATFRIINFGVNTSSLLGVIVAIVNSVGCWYIGKFKIQPWKKWSYATIYVLIISTVALSILLGNRNDFCMIIFIYWFSYCIVSAITYWYINYCLVANRLFRRLLKESSKDFLTGLNNVRQFDSVLNAALKNTLEKDENLSLLMIDIDFFKKVNDTYGHPAGDIVLKKLGEILSENCRTFDEVSRNGGEEFSVLLFDCPNSRASSIAERIRKNVETHPFVLSTGEKISITVSIGIASYPETVTDLEKLVEKADAELYFAKRTGRNKVCSNKSYL